MTNTFKAMLMIRLNVVSAIMKRGFTLIWPLLFVPGLILFEARPAVAAPVRILAVLSYHDDYPWQVELKNGIDTECGKECEITYFALDMKNNPQKGPEKASAAFQLYQKLQPDGVIAADDYAQSAFVVPYLRDKVKTPVIFCGVNEEPETYGYPASNVTGVLERFHFRETIDLLKTLVPLVKKIGFMMRSEDPTTTGMIKELRTSIRSFAPGGTEFRTPETVEEASLAARELGKRNDAVFIGHFEGLPDETGKRHNNREVVRMLLKEIGRKPTIAATEYTVKQGVLAGVVKTGAEQGTLAVKHLRAALSGQPVSGIPIVRNRAGIRFVNVKTMKSLGLEVKPALLRDVKLVTTE